MRIKVPKGFIKKYYDIPIQAKASMWYTVCNILQKGISFIVIPIYTRILTTAEYGQYSLFQSWCNILVIFATLNLYCGVFTKAMVDYSDDRDRYTSSMQGLSTLVTAVCFLVYILANQFWNGVFEMDTTTMILMFVYFIFYPSLSFWSVRQRVEYKYMAMVLVTLLVSVITPVVSIILLLYTNLRANAVIWGYLLTQSIAGAVFYIFHFVKGKVFFDKDYWVHGLKFNVPLIPHYLSLIVLGQADRIMINMYCGAEKTGVYNLAYQVSMIMNIFVNAINGSLVPWTYEKLNDKKYSEISATTDGLCIVVGIMTVGAILIAPELVGILGTDDYLQAIWIIPAVAISVYFTFCYGLFSNVEFYYGETQFVMIASAIGAVLNVVLNAIFVPMFGFIAAGYTTLFCYFVFMILHYVFMKKICAKHAVDHSIYNVKFITVSCLCLLLSGGICLLLYRETLVRYLVTGISIILVVFNKNRIKKLIVSVRR